MTRRNDEVGFGELLNLVEKLITEPAKEQRVISIDGEWGTGKTFFLERLGERLEEKSKGVIKINAWENDYLQDALGCLISETSSQLGKTDLLQLPTWSGLKDAWQALLKKAAPILVKAALGGLLDPSPIVDAYVEAAGETTAALLEETESTKDLFIKFRKELGKFAESVKEKTGSPLVFLVDELDRCRPDFALRILESVKHLFVDENVVFVFGVHRRQLAHATRAVYGPEFEGEKYLDRFFNLELRLPRSYERFVSAEWDRRLLSSDPKIKELATKQIVELCEYTSPNFRFIERVLNRLKIVLTIYPETKQTVFGVPQLISVLTFMRVRDRKSFDQMDFATMLKDFKNENYRFQSSEDGQYLINLVSVYKNGLQIENLVNSVQNFNTSNMSHRRQKERWIGFIAQFEVDRWPQEIQGNIDEMRNAITLSGIELGDEVEETENTDG